MGLDYRLVSGYLDEVARRLAESDHVSTVLLVGSFSRGDSKDTSDIDVVVISEPDQSVAELNSKLPESPYRQRVSLLPVSASVFRAMYRNGNLFARHVVREGRILYDDGFFKSITRETLPESRQDAWRTLKVAKERLAIYRNVGAFNNRHVYPASRVFSILRNVVVAGVAIKGEAVFGQDEAVRRFLEYYPQTRLDVERLLNLKPYALMTSRHRPPPDQTPRKMSASELGRMVDCLDRVIGSVEHSAEV